MNEQEFEALTKEYSEKPCEPKLTDAEIKEIAVGIHNGSIFTDRHCKNQSDVGLVFTAIKLGGMEAAVQMVKAQVGMVYESMDKASPHSVNGMPTFLSCNSINRTDADRVFDKYQEIKSEGSK
jgi:hypothetical protein